MNSDDCRGAYGCIHVFKWNLFELVVIGVKVRTVGSKVILGVSHYGVMMFWI